MTRVSFFAVVQNLQGEEFSQIGLFPDGDEAVAFTGARGIGRGSRLKVNFTKIVEVFKNGARVRIVVEEVKGNGRN